MHHIYEFDCGVPDGQKHPAKTEKNQIASIINGTGSKVGAFVEALKEAGYNVDEAAIAAHIEKQIEKEAMYERLYGPYADID